MIQRRLEWAGEMATLALQTNKKFDFRLGIVLHYIVKELTPPNMSSLNRTILFSSHIMRRLVADHQGLLRWQRSGIDTQPP